MEDVGLSQGETVIHVAAAGKREVSQNSHDVPFDKLARGEEESRAESPEQVRIKTVCVAGYSVLRSSFLCGEASKDGDNLNMPIESAAIGVAGVDEYVAVVGSSTLVHCGVEFEGFTFGKFVSHAFVRDSGGDVDISGLPHCVFLFYLIFTLYSLVKAHMLAICNFCKPVP